MDILLPYQAEVYPGANYVRAYTYIPEKFRIIVLFHSSDIRDPCPSPKSVSLIKTPVASKNSVRIAIIALNGFL